MASAVQLAKTGGRSLLGEGRYIKATVAGGQQGQQGLINALGLVVKAPEAQEVQQAADAMLTAGHRGSIGDSASRPSGPPRPVLVALLLCPEGFTPPAPPSSTKAAAGGGEEDAITSSSTSRLSPFGGGGGSGGPPSLPRSASASASSAAPPHDAQDTLEVYGTVGGRWFALLSLRLEDLILVTSRRRKQRLDSEAILAAGQAQRRQAATAGTGLGVGGLGASAVVMEAVEELLRCEKEEARAGGGGGAGGLEPLNFPKELKINDMAFVEEYGRCVFLPKILFVHRGGRSTYTYTHTYTQTD